MPPGGLQEQQARAIRATLRLALHDLHENHPVQAAARVTDALRALGGEP